MTAHGILLVVGGEFRVRLRTGRWRWLLGAWVLVIALFTLLLDLSLSGEVSSEDGPSGIPMFGALMLFVLALVLVVSPALTAQSVNGDRERGTLATLQVTRLTAAEIAVGKLFAGWAVGLAALALTLPFVGWSMLRGGIPITRAVVVLTVVSLLIGVVCAISQALSAMLARSITSALLSYVVVFALTIGTLIAFGLSVGVLSGDSSSRAERAWWLLAPNPFVVLADAAPQLPPQRDPGTGRIVSQSYDPLGELGRSVRQIRQPSADSGDPAQLPPVWPYGLGFNLAIGGLALWTTARRLRTPMKTVPKGVRIA
jgi:ABC-type transport system involved in multi-copper enzyme maturation permease subunit